jgi:hypothetical protein
MIPVETITRIGERGLKETAAGDEFKDNIFDTL